MLMAFVLIATLCLRPLLAFTTCSCQKLRPSLTEEDIQRGGKKRVLDALRWHYIKERLQGYWNVGVRMVETVQNNQYY